ncbi:hypothetical protein KDD17_00785 [Sulfitobacter albidus]|uniref:Uncharacterized protein n=1 Tax=Sulfitobacter albidus TaxID=2829501 RepID=A0A975JDU0_9RHOB|nr:hypothetical protein [Sulfitobacter albidus]QUJ76644.1 hypothetical protein KDD17_00785 [Sulfitobacter albidus]
MSGPEDPRWSDAYYRSGMQTLHAQQADARKRQQLIEQEREKHLARAASAQGNRTAITARSDWAFRGFERWIDCGRGRIIVLVILALAALSGAVVQTRQAAAFDWGEVLIAAFLGALAVPLLYALLRLVVALATVLAVALWRLLVFALVLGAVVMVIAGLSGVEF